MMELLKSAPALIPLVKTPDGFHKHAAKALVAHAINGAQSARVSAGVFARTAADKATDLAAVVEAVPIEDLGVHLGASALAEPAHGRLFDESCALAGRVLLELVHARFDLQDDSAMRVEHLNNPGIEPGDQCGPTAGSPPALGNQVVGKVLQKPPAVSGQHIARLEELRALPPTSPASFCSELGARTTLKTSRCAQHPIKKLQAEFAGIPFVRRPLSGSGATTRLSTPAACSSRWKQYPNPQASGTQIT